MIKRHIIIALVFGPALLFGGYYSLGKIWSPTGSDDAITIADASQPVFALIYIAHMKGYFEAEGLDVTFKSYDSGRDALNSVIDGEADLATVYETPIVLKTYEGVELSVISSLHESTENTGLVARKDRGIATFSDLKGKTIAVTKNTNGEFFISQYLTSQGINLSEVTLVDVPPGEMAGALKEGRVDAVATWNPNLYNAQHAFAEDEIITFYSDTYTEFSVLAGSRRFVMERKKTLQKLLRAVVKAERFLASNPDEALDLVIRRLFGQPEETIRGVWDAADCVARLDNLMLTIF